MSRYDKNMQSKVYGYTAKLAVCVLAIVLVSVHVPVTDPVSKPGRVATPQKPRFMFPEGGRSLFPHYRLVALYGTPNLPVLGGLGQQSPQASIVRVKQIAKSYQPYSAQPILPTLEIITTIASASPTANKDYSQELDPTSLKPWIMAAQASGVYVVLDLQPGRQSFLPQAKEYAALLQHPNVGLALDPEWHLGPNELPLEQIGSANIKDVNQMAAWLATLTKQYKLPQKLFLLHQFRLSMLPDRAQLNTTYPQLAYAIQMDGQGTQAQKLSTWHAIIAQPPQNVYFGWKNFYLKDAPLRTPAATMALTPKPWYVSYQ